MKKAKAASAPRRIDALPLVLTVAELQGVMRWGRGKTYQWTRDNPGQVVRVGATIRVPRAVVARLLGEPVA